MTISKGIIHGKTIELDVEPGFPDGQQVTVIVNRALPPGEGIRQSAGGWADGGEALDRWLEAMQQSRQIDRAEPNP
jgi:hypothetical protein